MIPPEKRKEAVLKRKETMARKKQMKEQKKIDNSVKRHSEHLLNINSNINKVAYARVIQALHKYKNKKIMDTGARYKGREIMAINVKSNLDRETILREVNKISKILSQYDSEGLLDLSVKGDKWYYQGQSKFGKKVEFRDEYDDVNEDTFSEFAIYIATLPKPQMGNSNNNDCVYNCLLSVLGSRLLKVFPSPVDMKKFLKIPYYSKVDINHIELIEKKLNVSINVSGDYTYTTRLNNNKEINLKCINEHCELEQTKKDIFRLNKKRSHYERKPLIFNKQYFEAFNGTDKFNLTKEMRNNIYDWKTEYILINRFDFKKVIEDNYIDFIDMANNLKAETKGRINLYKTGNFTNTALILFDETTKHINHPPEIKQVESEFINGASQGAIIFNTKGYRGKVYKGDVKSMYPSILSSNMLFPVKEGELKYITEFHSEFFQYGIYRAKVHYENTKLFRFNFDNFYTHIDLTRAKELNLKIELIIDDQPNFLYYSRDKCLTGSEIFGEFVNYLFNLKEKKFKGAKNILNCLWGSLCECNRKKIIHKSGDKLAIPDDVKPTFRPFNDNNTIIKYTKFDKQHKYGWARIKPFILAKGRQLISKIMEPYNDILVRCHTDGVLFSEEPKNIKYGSNMGDFVFEGIQTVQISFSGEVIVLN